MFWMDFLKQFRMDFEQFWMDFIEFLEQFWVNFLEQFLNKSKTVLEWLF